MNVCVRYGFVGQFRGGCKQKEADCRRSSSSVVDTVFDFVVAASANFQLARMAYRRRVGCAGG